MSLFGWELDTSRHQVNEHFHRCGVYLLLPPHHRLSSELPGANGDVKIGDFGLATSSLAGIDPSDVAKSALKPSLDITYGASSIRCEFIPRAPLTDFVAGVGTALYTAPEVLSKSKGHANHSKADMYSLGVKPFCPLDITWS